MQPVKQHSMVKLLPVRCPGCDFHARWNLHAGEVVEVSTVYQSQGGALFAAFIPPWEPRVEWIVPVGMVSPVDGFDTDPSWLTVERVTGWSPPRRKPSYLQYLFYRWWPVIAPLVAL